MQFASEICAAVKFGLRAGIGAAFARLHSAAAAHADVRHCPDLFSPEHSQEGLAMVARYFAYAFKIARSRSLLLQATAWAQAPAVPPSRRDHPSAPAAAGIPARGAGALQPPAQGDPAGARPGADP